MSASIDEPPGLRAGNDGGDGADRRPLIAHVVFRFDVGGLENGVVNLINRLPHERFRHAVVALTKVTDFARRIERSDVVFHALDKGPGHGLKLAPRLYRLFRDMRPAIVHTRNLAALEASVPAWAARVPVRVHSEHGWDVGDLSGTNRKYRWIRRAHRPFVTQYIALSRDLQRYLQSAVGVPAGRVAQIYNGVDTRRFRPRGGARAHLPGMPFGDECWVVGTVGRLQPVKDQVGLARAFVHAVSSDSDARRRMRLAIAGDGPQREPIVDVLRAGGVLDLAWLAGERQDVPEFMRALDCFVLPSLAEGISNTILEAMATALPIVASAVGGNNELIDDGQTGTLVPPAAPVRTAAAMLQYLSDPARARAHARAAREVAERKYSLERMVSDYAGVYERAIASGRAAMVPVSNDVLTR